MPTYTINIQGTEKVVVQESNTTILSVLFEICKDGQVVQVSRHGFPLEATHDDIVTDLRAVLAAYSSDEANAVRNAAFEAANKQADETIAALDGATITSDEVAAPNL